MNSRSPLCRVLLLAGATASGKSSLALRLARELEGEIINADSMQVYDALPQLTARPTLKDRAVAPHHLYGHVPPGVAYSVGEWLDAAKKTLADVHARGRLALVVGGTGLYFQALTRGLAPLPAVPPALRAQLEERLTREGAAALHAQLEACDPVSARALAPSDRQRLVRALGVFEASGRPLSAWLQEQKETSPLVGMAVARCVLTRPRAELHARAEARLEAMLTHGALDEVRALLEHNLNPGLPVMKAIGVRPFARALAGEIDLAAALTAAKTETRRYIKRQSTWFRHQMPNWPCYSPEEAFPALSSAAFHRV